MFYLAYKPDNANCKQDLFIASGNFHCVCSTSGDGTSKYLQRKKLVKHRIGSIYWIIMLLQYWSFDFRYSSKCNYIVIR